MSKRGYYFTLDVIIASFVLAIGFLLLFLYVFSSPSPEVVYEEADNVNAFLAETTVQAARVPVPYINQLVLDGNITRTDNTLWEQMGLFMINNRTQLARGMATNITSEIFDFRFGGALLLNGTQLWNTTGEENASILIGDRHIFVVINNSDIHGPLVGEVRVWQ